MGPKVIYILLFSNLTAKNSIFCAMRSVLMLSSIHGLFERVPSSLVLGLRLKKIYLILYHFVGYFK